MTKKPSRLSQYYRSLIPHLPGELAKLPWVVSGEKHYKTTPSFTKAAHAILCGDVCGCTSVLHDCWDHCSEHVDAETEADYNASNVCPDCIQRSRNRVWSLVIGPLRIIPDGYYVDQEARVMHALEIEDYSPVDDNKARKLDDLGWWFDDMSWTLQVTLYYPGMEITNSIPDASQIFYNRMHSSSWLRAFNSTKQKVIHQ